MQTTEEQIKQLLEKALRNTISPEEKQLLQAWISRNGYHINLDHFFPYEEWTEIKEDPLPEGLAEKVFSLVLGPTGTSKPVDEDRKPANVFSLKRFRFTAAAAVLMVLLTGWWLFAHRQNQQQVWVEQTAARGETKTLLLPDSTVVHLNAASTLRYPEHFTTNRRDLQLTGEAYFEVKHDPSKPFTVTTRQVKTTVVGTAFNIKAYNESKDILVAVTRGKVRVQASDKQSVVSELFLTPGMQARYNERDPLLHVTNVDINNISAWCNNRLVFEDETLDEICQSLGRHFNVQFRAYHNQQLSCRYSASFDQLTLAASLDKLTLLGGVHFEIKGKDIRVISSPCNP